VDAFASTADYTKTYRFVHNDIYSNLNLILLDPAGLVESMTAPDEAVPVMGAEKEKAFTLTFKPDIKTLVPSNGDSLTVKLIATYTNNNGFSKVAYLEIRIEDGTCICPAKIDANTWLNFMCHNLGALDVISSSQLVTREHHGDWYRFGATQISMKNIQANDNTVAGYWDNPNHHNVSGDDWPTDATGTPPCPAGWRVPTKEEWAGAINVHPDQEGNNPIALPNNILARIPDPWSSGNEFSRILKIGDYLYLPNAGCRYHSSGQLYERGTWGSYWSSSNFNAGNPGGRLIYFSETYIELERGDKTWGYSLRCVSAE
jgi:uncharacterized protein (TIGR02145 family)